MGCRSVLFAKGAILFYMKARNLNRPTKLSRSTVENARNAAENFL
jgi:hypothetical protein